jgi:hypothetical protein
MHVYTLDLGLSSHPKDILEILLWGNGRVTPVETGTSTGSTASTVA